EPEPEAMEPEPEATAEPEPEPVQEAAREEEEEDAFVDPEAEKMPFAAYSKVAARIYSILTKARKDPEKLNSYFESAPANYAPILEGVRIESGKLTMTRLLRNARRHSGEQYKGRALEALEAFQTFALFQVKNELPIELSRKVQKLVVLIHLGKA
ncbi:MAG: hypothetical protein ACOC0J_02705, partial [Myxococcota bacterium]